MSYTVQLWEGLWYGLGACAANLKVLEKRLRSLDYELISHLGVIWTIKNEWRYLPAAFCKMGLNDITIKTATKTTNVFLQNFGMDSALGIMLQATPENLQLELGVLGCPLDYDFQKWCSLATDSWIKSF